MDTRTYKVDLKAKEAVETAKLNIDIAITPPNKERILFHKSIKQDMREAIIITANNQRLIDILGYDNAVNMKIAPRVVLSEGVTELGATFCNFENITELDLTEWGAVNFTHTANTFQNCYKLEYLDISNWNTSASHSFNGMFKNCESLQTIDGIIDMANCDTKCQSMFKNCPQLKGVKLKNVPYDMKECLPGKSVSLYQLMGFDSLDQFEIVS